MIKNIKRELIVERLADECWNCYNMRNTLADEMIEKCPEELELNVQEWLDRKEKYTEIRVGELSVPLFFEYSPLANFPDVIIEIGDYVKNDKYMAGIYLNRFAIL
jgi:hypothetical protein